MNRIEPSFLLTPEYDKYLDKNPEKRLEELNMEDYARSLRTQEGSPVAGPSLSEIAGWGGKTADPTNPAHYQNADKKFEHRFVAKAWGLEYYLSAATKYIARCGKKSSVGMTNTDKEIQDLQKSIVYIQFRIDELRGK